MLTRGLRRQFPIFKRRIHGKPLVYLDSAATTQKPVAVLSAMDNFYRRHNANPRRGLYALGVEATAMVEQARQHVAEFIGAKDPAEIIFTSGATAAVNLVGYSWAEATLRAGDGIMVSQLEHHSNFVPWQQLAQRHRWRLLVVPLMPDGNIDIRWLRRHLTRRVKLLSITHTSNALGIRLPISPIIRLAHRYGTRVLVDAAQGVAHQPVNVRQLGCDWLVFSAHKMYGPMGVGVLWGRRELLESAPPFLYGGEMVSRVAADRTTFAGLPAKFEGGTQNAAGIVGLGAAIGWLKRIGYGAISRHERTLTSYVLRRLSVLPGIAVYGPKAVANRGPVISFNVAGVHAHDVAQILDQHGVAVRAGHHCAMPLMQHLGVPATVRVSFGVYNTKADVDRLIAGLKQIQKIFR